MAKSNPCECCDRKNVRLSTNVWLKAALCNACLCTWYSGASRLTNWEQLKTASLASGDKWLRE